MNSEKILVTSYQDPDLDGFACAVAYTDFLKKLGQSAVLAISGEPHDEAKFLLKKYGILFENSDINPAEFGKIILVDASDLEGIDPRINPDNIIEVIDHRKVNQQGAFRNAKIQVELVGSAATLIAEKYFAANIEIPKTSAILLFGAIVSNTLNFRAQVTTDRDRAAAQRLAEIVSPSSSFAHELFESKSQINESNLDERIAHDFATFDFGQRVGVAQLEIVDGAKLVAKLKVQILAKLKSLKDSSNLDIIFLTVIDLDANQNIFVTENPASQDLLRNIFDLQFTDNTAIRPGFIMRKEIMPLIKTKILGNVSG